MFPNDLQIVMQRTREDTLYPEKERRKRKT